MWLRSWAIWLDAFRTSCAQYDFQEFCFYKVHFLSFLIKRFKVCEKDREKVNREKKKWEKTSKLIE